MSPLDKWKKAGKIEKNSNKFAENVNKYLENYKTLSQLSQRIIRVEKILLLFSQNNAILYHKIEFIKKEVIPYFRYLIENFYDSIQSAIEYDRLRSDW